MLQLNASIKFFVLFSLLIIFLIFSNQSYAEEIYLQEIQKNIKIEKEIGANIIQLIKTEEDIFALTPDYLLKFSGTHFERIISIKEAKCAVLDSANNLWIGSSSGFEVVDIQSEQKKTETIPPFIESISTIELANQAKLWVGTSSGLYLKQKESWDKIEELGDNYINSIYFRSENELWISTNNGLFKKENKIWMNLCDLVLAPGWGKIFTCLGEGLGKPGILFGNAIGIGFISDKGNHWVETAASGLPYGAVNCILDLKNELWIGTEKGAAKHSDEKWHYYAGKRWLPVDKVNDIIQLDNRRIWIATTGGVSEIKQEEMTLLKKSQVFEERINKRHLRYGLVSNSRLRSSGDLYSNQTFSNDNDGLWTAIYLAGECFRYAVTREKAAYKNAVQAFEAMERLETITPIKGFPSRSYAKINEDVGQGGEWHPTRDGKWKWKGDTSSDEIVGHMFAYPIFYDLVAEGELKIRVRDLVSRIMNYIVNNNFLLIDLDGKPTRWGVWTPDSLNNNPVWWYERGINSLQILSFLRAAYHVTREEKFRVAYYALIENSGYARNTIEQKMYFPFEINHSDDELAFLPYYILFRYADDPELIPVYEKSMQRSWQVERPEKNPLWNFIASFALEKDCGISDAIETLQLTPWSLIDWRMENSHRWDIQINHLTDRFGGSQALHPISIKERAVSKWNANPYRLDGGGRGTGEDDGAFWLCPYWMGRYHQFIME